MKLYLRVCVLLFSMQMASGSWNHLPAQVENNEPQHKINFQLCISENRRFLMYDDGTPFFYLGDTAWELFHRLNESEIEYYLEDRRSKGFNVIQAVILAESDGLNTPDRNGNRPLIDNDPTQPNEEYFAWIDKIIRMAESKNLYVGLLPTWGDKVDKHQAGKGPVVFNKENAEMYGRFLGKRYAAFPNIIWINGGDRQGGGDNFSIWDALGKAIKAEDKNHLMTYHPSGEASSSQWFHNCDWLDFNVCQTSHAHTGYEIYYRLLVRDYHLKPVKPCMDAEPRYEDIPVAYREKNRRFDAADVRNALYWSLFSGAFGFVYGCNDIWQFYDQKQKPEVFARNHWRTALQFEGSSQMIHARNLLLKYDFFSRVPDQNMVVKQSGEDFDFVTATCGKDYAFVYLPQGNPVEISLEKIKNRQILDLKWMDPRTGEIIPYVIIPAEGTFNIQPPTSGQGNDWVLIMENVKSKMEVVN